MRFYLEMTASWGTIRSSFVPGSSKKCLTYGLIGSGEMGKLQSEGEYEGSQRYEL